MSRPRLIRSLIACAALFLTGAARGSPTPVLYSFLGGSDGSNPSGALLPGDHGAVFGTTVNGGAAGLGTVFELMPVDGGYRESVNFNFHGSDGAHPYAGLVKTGSRSGVGSTHDGGIYGLGTVFQMIRTENGPSQRVLYNFRGGTKDGANPYGGLTVGPGGQLFGTTTAGGSNHCAGGCGVVYRLTPTSSTYVEDVVYKFRGGTDGAHPEASLLRAGGVFYGTTHDGGAGNLGTAFMLTPAGHRYSETVLHGFAGPDGANPIAGLAAGPGGELDGTTTAGGGGNAGVMFALVPAPSGAYAETVDWTFGGVSGAQPSAPLATLASGLLAGTTAAGGASGNGVVYTLTRGASGMQENVVYAFQGTPDGSYPQGGVVALATGQLVGTTYAGGQSGLGTIYGLSATASRSGP
jgi:uncharacterized repeat protein (TIGR03803 family)